MKSRPPGQLRASVDPDVVMMICTAGHVDHGKTQLVKFLTGCQTDRLKDERERGLTIDLGFAPCYLGGNLCIGIVDVPGHEKFVRNMVAGVSGIGFTVLVVAADDGIMPQTVEHLQIMELLGVPRGMVALTKIDLVTESVVERRAEEITAFLRGTFLADCPICPVSSETFEGIPEFYDTLVERAVSSARQEGAGVFRMPVERVFSPRGVGTVVTGIPVAGEVRTGDAVEIVPGSARGTVRGIQCFLRDAERGGRGQCLALNVPELGKQSPVRGQVVCAPGFLQPATVFHLRLMPVPGLDAPLRNGEDVKLHTGTAEVSGKLYLLGLEDTTRDGIHLATVVAAAPVAAAVDDRFILRRPSPPRTVGGGRIVRLEEGPRRPSKRVCLEALRQSKAFREEMAATDTSAECRKIRHYLRLERPAPANCGRIARGTLLPTAVVADAVQRLTADGMLVGLEGGLFVDPAVYKRTRAALEARVRRFAEDERRLILPTAELRPEAPCPPQLWRRLLADLEHHGLIETRGNTVILKSAVRGLSPADRELAGKICEVYEDTAFKSPRPEELPALLGARADQVRRMTDYLCSAGTLVRLSKNVVLSASCLRQAQDMVVRTIGEKGYLDSADFKYDIGSSRKYALAILDHLDERGLTIRSGNVRRLTPDYAKRVL